VTLFTEELPWLKGRDLELVMGRGVCDWLGWKRHPVYPSDVRPLDVHRAPRLGSAGH
jgi:hypothetical protein